MKKAVLFDVDGVLLDSLDANGQFYRDIMKHAGYPEPTMEQIKNIFHLMLKDGIRELTGAPQEEALHIWQETYTLPYPAHLLKLQPGVTETLDTLRQSHALGVVTSRTARGIGVFFSFSKLEPYFDVVIGCEDVKNPKPHPEPLLLAASRLGVSPADAVYVGDAHTDVEAAKAAGMKAVAFHERWHPGSDARTTSFAGLPEVLKQLYL